MDNNEKWYRFAEDMKQMRKEEQIKSFLVGDKTEAKHFGFSGYEDLVKEDLITLRDYIISQAIKKYEFDKLAYPALESIRKKDSDVVKINYPVNLRNEIEIIYDKNPSIAVWKYKMNGDYTPASRILTRNPYLNRIINARWNKIDTFTNELDEIFKIGEETFDDSINETKSISNSFSFTHSTNGVFGISSDISYMEYDYTNGLLIEYDGKKEKRINSNLLDRIQIEKVRRRIK